MVSTTGCWILLDVNNIYVNFQNHGYDPLQFIQSLDSDSISYYHIAGHWQKTSELIIDRHGSDLVEPVWNLLDFTYKTHGVKPTLLERDNDILSLSELESELSRI